MIVIVGLVVLLVAVIVGFTGVLTNAGAAHPLTEDFSLFGYHVTGSTGTLFLSGIVVGAVAMLGLSVLLAGARRTAGRGRDARHELKRSQRETAFLNQERDQRLEQQQSGMGSGSSVNPQPAPVPSTRVPLLGRFSRGRQPTGSRRTPVGTDPRSMRSARPVITENEGIRNERR